MRLARRQSQRTLIMSLSRWPVVFVLLCLHTSMPAQAEPACMKDSHTAEEINICQHTEAKQLELQLKNLEESVRSRLKGVQLDRFNSAEASWLDMTNKDCEIESDFYEGSPVYIATQSKCLQNHYLARMHVIRNYLCPDYSITNGCEPGNIPLPDSLIPLRTAVPVVDSPPVNFQAPASPPKKIEGGTRFR